LACAVVCKVFLSTGRREILRFFSLFLYKKGRRKKARETASLALFSRPPRFPDRTKNVRKGNTRRQKKRGSLGEKKRERKGGGLFPI